MLKLLLIITLCITSVNASKKYCNNLTEKQRMTSIYLDLSNTNNTKFAKSLLSGLSNNFLPHEKVQIFSINPLDLSIDQIYSSCVPKLSYAEIKKVKAEGSFKYMLGGNPIETAKEDMTFFMSELKQILVQAYNRNVNDTFENKELIEMFYNETSMFETRPMQRVIIYSDMIQKSKEIKTDDLFKDAIDPKVLSEYKTNFNYSEFYIYTSKKKFGISKNNKLVKFWKKYIEKNNGYVAYFNDNLKLPKIKDLRSKKYTGELEINGKKYDSNLFLNYSSNMKASNSWFVINGIDAIPLVGKVKLTKGKLNKIILSVANISKGNHTLFTGDEKIEIKVLGKKINGDIKIDNTEIILNGETIKNPTFNISMKESDE